MTAYGEVKVQLHTFLTSKLDGVCGQLYTPAALPPARELQVPCEEGGMGGVGHNRARRFGETTFVAPAANRIREYPSATTLLSHYID
jgi:hypothetical protein